MKKLILNLKNCYGIKKLNNEFDFSSSKTFAIYAPNSSMKTSLANTFRDLANNSESKDLAFPTRETVREIKKEDGSDLTSKEVFVIEPYNQDFSSEKMSTLLVNMTLKKRYDEIHLKIDEGKESFFKELKKISQFKGDLDDEISLTFTSRVGDLVLSLNRLEKEVLDDKPSEFADIIYNEVFNKKVYDFLRTEDFKDKVEDYIKKYEDLISKSKYFKKGIFNHNNASVIAKSLIDNGFFQADHSVYLHSKEGNNKIYNEKELEKVIEEEKSNILNNPALVKAFERIDGKLNANVELRRFRDYLSKNIRILPELKRLNGFRQKLWVSYFKEHKNLYKILIGEYHSSEIELKKIAEQANAEKTKWQTVIDIFTKRFSVPFKVEVDNQEDVILRKDLPNLIFKFQDSTAEPPIKIERGDLLQILSTGERRALYILNIIFEVQARINSKQETLFIVDDIADSFDYKNKYAIIEYLKDISTETNFRQIILTHNFDFFRTIQSRFVLYKDCLMVEKLSQETKLIPASYVKNPLVSWMNNLDTNNKQLIASIPFARNLIEYTKGDTDSDYLKLTSLLHFKADTFLITKNDLTNIYKNVFPKLKLVLSNPTEKIFDLLIKSAEDCLSETGVFNLENKIMLSIAIRLKAEIFMAKKITDQSEIKFNQTRVLFDKYEKEFSDKQKNIYILGQVNLMTPENIHLNSFMYEPILDMSDDLLKNLYQDVCSLS